MKRVVIELNVPNVALMDVDDDNIYTFKGCTDIYKAHRIEDDKFAFVSLNDSKCYANGIYDSLEKLIEYTLLDDDEVFEFVDFKEFVEWLNNEV
jgi:hypothetical protein